MTIYNSSVLSQETTAVDLDAYKESLDPVIEKIANIANDNSFQIIIVYHSEFTLTDLEGLIRTDHPEMADAFREVCDRYSVSFIDVSDMCIEHYQSTYEAPCGFMNSVIGSGHLNKTGHDIIAKAVYQKICELSGVEENDVQ